MSSERVDTQDDPLDLTADEEARAAKLHRDAPFVDGLVAGTYYLDDPDYRDRLREAGVLAGNLTVGGPSFGFEETVGAVTAVRETLEANDDNYRLVESMDDIETVRSEDRTGIVLGFQGANWATTSRGYGRCTTSASESSISPTTGGTHSVTGVVSAAIAD
jgi:hypothetical protein